jgi:uncharacterized membrane protein YfcA
VLNIFIGLIIGVVTGVVGALCGVGGGIIMVPAFVAAFGLSQKQAVGTSLAAVILTAVAATAKNQANGFIEWKIVFPTAIAGAVVAWFASDWLKTFSNENLTKIFSVVLIGVGISMWFKK